MAANENARGLTMKLDIEVSEALTGLKAIQREAKAATKALRELEKETQHSTLYRNANGEQRYSEWSQQGDEVHDVKDVKVADVLAKVKADE